MKPKAKTHTTLHKRMKPGEEFLLAEGILIVNTGRFPMKFMARTPITQNENEHNEKSKKAI